MPLISLIVPVYNVAQYLPRCLAMISNQKFCNFEIIFINDGSTDNSEQILEAWIKKQDDTMKITIINQKNQGLGAARNRGIEKAQGSYFWCLDSDDFITADALSYLADAIHTYPHVQIFGFQYRVWPRHLRELRCYDRNYGTNLDIRDISACDKLIQREFWQNHNFEFPEGYYYEDTGIIPITIDLAQSVRYLPRNLYYYEVTREAAITKRTRYERLQDFISMQKRICDYYIQTRQYDKLSAYEYQCIHTIMADILARNVSAPSPLREQNFNATMEFFQTYFPNWQRNQQLQRENNEEKKWILTSIPLMELGKYHEIPEQNYLLYTQEE
ncbi:MAG: glycosyltransferase family 2 protein [Culicoidibacterales bacterium]